MEKKKKKTAEGIAVKTESLHTPRVMNHLPVYDSETRYLAVLDLKAAVLQQGEAGVLPGQADPIFPPGDGGLGLSGRLTPQQRHASQHLRLVGGALADDGWRAILQG